MTFFTVLNLIEKYQIDELSTFVEISENAANITGTSAELEEGDKLTIWDLFYALMLPSGNDAATVLAEYFGEILINERSENEQLNYNQ